MTARIRAGLLVALGAALLVPASAGAATFRPTTTADEFDMVGTGAGCALREAIQAANTDGDFGGCSGPDQDGDTIVLRKGAVYVRSLDGAADNSNATGDLDVQAESLVLAGNGATIEGNDTQAGDRVLHIQGGIEVSIDGVTIRAGNVSGSGGGLLNLATTTISNSTISRNTASVFGGGIQNTTGAADLRLLNVTVSANFANSDSGGIDGDSGAVLLANSTITANTADADASSGGDGGGVKRFGGTMQLRNTIIENNSDATGDGLNPDCNGAPTSLGHNLIGDTTGCAWAAAAGDVLNVPASLGPLADNGGPVRTHAVGRGTPAFNAGNPAAPGSGADSCEAKDARGVQRALGGRCDIGAYELVRCAGRNVNVVGTPGRNVLSGRGRADVFLLLGGNDVARGRGGNDTICGGRGRDKLLGGPGRDRLFGGPGRDVLKGGPGRDVLKGGPGRDRQRQ